MSAIEVQSITAGYGKHIILEDVSVRIPKGKVTMIIGPNGCGKSTLLKHIARIKRPGKGRILLEQKDMAKLSSKAIARKMAILPQSPVAPSGLLVKELVSFGRFPYQKPMGPLQKEDMEIIERSMKQTGILAQKDTLVETLSGGQRQRAWIALALAQNTDIIVLDEPTTYLDISYQLELLELLKQMNKDSGQTIIMVLHELNLACRYADHIIGMKQGKILFEGKPNDVITPEHLHDLYGIRVQLQKSKDGSYPICVDYE